MKFSFPYFIALWFLFNYAEGISNRSAIIKSFKKRGRSMGGNKTKIYLSLPGDDDKISRPLGVSYRVFAPIVQLDDKRKVNGITYNSRRGRQYFGYLGIPYGQAPQRFADPIEHPGWPGEVLQNDEQPKFCAQWHSFINKVDGEEDCLKLCVYTRNVYAKVKKPVIVWTSPGGFNMGGAKLFKGAYLIDQGVVVVTINNRVGALGFLNTMDGTVSGNMGLKDQTMALRWVQKYIDKFGGDPNLVTFAGLSCGGASVEYHTLSEMSRGLFQRGIAMSGSVLNPWAFQPDPQPMAIQLGKDCDCRQKLIPNMVACLRTKTIYDIIVCQTNIVQYTREFDFISMRFVPSIEINDGRGEKFMTSSPYQLLVQGKIVNKVPMLFGFIENEGGFYTAELMTKSKSIKFLNSNWQEMAGNIFYFDHVVNRVEFITYKITKQIWDFYLNKKLVSSRTHRNLSNLYSDRLFLNGIAKAIKLHAEHQPIYPYIFTYQGDHSGIEFDFNAKRDGGVHADDMNYLFDKISDYPFLDYDTPDGIWSEKYCNLFKDFMEHGYPPEFIGTTFPQYKNKKEPIYYQTLDFKPQKLKDPYAERRQFWDDLKLIEHEHQNDTKGI